MSDEPFLNGSPDGISVERLQEGKQEPEEPWASMEDVGAW